MYGNWRVLAYLTLLLCHCGCTQTTRDTTHQVSFEVAYSEELGTFLATISNQGSHTIRVFEPIGGVLTCDLIESDTNQKRAYPNGPSMGYRIVTLKPKEQSTRWFQSNNAMIGVPDGRYKVEFAYDDARIYEELRSADPSEAQSVTRLGKLKDRHQYSVTKGIGAFVDIDPRPLGAPNRKTEVP